MQKRAFALVLVGMSGVAALAGGCNDTPTQPSETSSHFRQVELTGPVTIAPGEVAQYTLTATPNLGGPRDVSNGATWASGMPSALKVDKGLATAVQPGESAITAHFAGRSSTKTVVVTPRGTFRVKGSVVQSTTSGSIAGAAVEARSPSGDVLRTVTAGDGSFAIYGVPPESELQVTHPAYLERAQQLTLTEHATVRVELTPTNTIPSVAGDYTLTIGSSGCTAQGGRVQLAGPLRQRSYSAVISQKGTALEVTLSGPEFYRNGANMANRFWGTIAGERLTFFLSGPEDHYYYYSGGPYVAERMEDGTYLISSGNATLNFSGRDLRGTLSGYMRNSATPGSNSSVAQCDGVLPFVFVK